MKKLLFILLSIIFFFLPLKVFASESWVIENFQSNIYILNSGKVQIEETIVVDFKSNAKHGIFRDIPYVYSLPNNNRLYSTIEVLNVVMDARDIPYQESTIGSYYRLKIGDPNKTISGRHVYQINYAVTGIIRPFENYDELYWNVTGNNWEVPIMRASAQVNMPLGGIMQIRCFEGESGATIPCISNNFTANSASFASGSLSAGKGLTIVVGFNKGLVPVLTVSPPKVSEQPQVTLLSPIALLLSFLGSLVLSSALGYFVWYRNGRDFWNRVPLILDKSSKAEKLPFNAPETIVVEFDPPEKLRPAEIGVLMDEKADTLDVTATIIDLAVRGYLTIMKKEKKWLFGNTDYILTKKDKDEAGLLNYEKELLTRLFMDGKEVSLSSLKNEFYDDLKKVKKKLYEDMVGRGYFPQNPETIRTQYTIVSVLILIIGIVFLVAGIPFFAFGGALMMIGLGLSLSFIPWLFFARSMGKRTALGRELFRRSRGYELFISKAEKYRQQFFERKNMFNEILPYAIVFGVTEKFAKSFVDLGIKPPASTWYYGVSAFNTVNFTSSIDDFSNSLSSAIISQPGRSGFSSSGGFSGGGFGGGGGGSW